MFAVNCPIQQLYDVQYLLGKNILLCYYENNYNLCNNDLYNLPQIRLELFRKIPLYSLPFEWNNLGNFVFHKNKNLFRNLLKEKLLEDITDQLRIPTYSNVKLNCVLLGSCWCVKQTINSLNLQYYYCLSPSSQVPRHGLPGSVSAGSPSGPSPAFHTTVINQLHPN